MDLSWTSYQTVQMLGKKKKTEHKDKKKVLEPDWWSVEARRVQCVEGDGQGAQLIHAPDPWVKVWECAAASMQTVEDLTLACLLCSVLCVVHCPCLQVCRFLHARPALLWSHALRSLSKVLNLHWCIVGASILLTVSSFALNVTL